MPMWNKCKYSLTTPRNSVFFCDFLLGSLREIRRTTVEQIEPIEIHPSQNTRDPTSRLDICRELLLMEEIPLTTTWDV